MGSPRCTRSTRVPASSLPFERQPSRRCTVSVLPSKRSAPSGRTSGRAMSPASSSSVEDRPAPWSFRSVTRGSLPWRAEAETGRPSVRCSLRTIFFSARPHSSSHPKSRIGRSGGAAPDQCPSPTGPLPRTTRATPTCSTGWGSPLRVFRVDSSTAFRSDCRSSGGRGPRTRSCASRRLSAFATP